MAFLVVVISLLIIYFSGAVPGIQRDGWYVSWLTYLRKSTDSGKRPKTYLTVSLLVPVGVLMVVLWFAKGLLFGLPVLVLNVLLLLYAFGREDVTSKAYVYTEALSRGDFQAAFHQAAVFNLSHHEGRARNQGELHREVLQAISIGILNTILQWCSGIFCWALRRLSCIDSHSCMGIWSWMANMKRR
ncbi:MAG: regulatory signaling modulator protein AmpE [Porticoccaceae bacterium]